MFSRSSNQALTISEQIDKVFVLIQSLLVTEHACLPQLLRERPTCKGRLHHICTIEAEKAFESTPASQPAVCLQNGCIQSDLRIHAICPDS